MINLQFAYEKTIMGLNYDPTQVPDRLGYGVYAKAIAAFVAAAELRDIIIVLGFMRLGELAN